MSDKTFDAVAGDMPDDADDGGCEFSDLSPEQQKEMMTHLMEGKPQTTANMNAARATLSNDPDTVMGLCEKLDIKPNYDGDDDAE